MSFTNQGKLFVIEGMDGAGKQTQATLLKERLEKEGFPIIQVSFPNYESESSVLVRKYLQKEFETSRRYVDNISFTKQMASFYSVDRVATFLTPTYNGKPLMQLIREGMNVICDRYTTSNILHQSANLDNIDHISEFIAWITELEYGHFGLPKPTEVFFLDVPPQLSMVNIKNRYGGLPKEDLLENINHLNKIFSIKDKLIEYCGWKQVKCYDTHMMLPVEKIHERIYLMTINKLLLE